MLLPLKLERFAFHYVDQKLEHPLFSAGEVAVGQLPQVIQDFLLDMVYEIWHAPDAGSTRSARFGPQAGEVRACLEALRNSETEFFAASQVLAGRLRDESHPKASPGILGIMRLGHLEDGQRYVAVIKIRHRNEELVRLLSPGAPQLDVAQVQNVLRREIQKGAMLPHPDKTDYDLKVIDAQGRDDPAAYFTEKFLGCISKKSDDLQVRKLVPALERLAEDRAVTLAVEKLPQVLSHLKEQPADITPQVVAQAVAAEQLFDASIAPADVVAYLEQANMGDLDIPKEQFERKRKSGRKVIYRFMEPDLDGLEISGPPEVLARILRAEGERVIFTVQTENGGFRFEYQ